MKLDISSRKDLHFVISEFYRKLLSDKKMLPFFQAIIDDNTLEHHLESITDFWEDIVFDTQKYHNNTMKKHTDKHAFVQFKKEHFQLWIAYFFETIDEYFYGAKCELIKSRATSIATVMQLKMNVFNN